MLLELFYNIIDPTSLNKQGLDAGTQYRTGIYTVDDADLAVARRSLEKLQTRFDKPVVVECQPLDCFYTAEEYHQKYPERVLPCFAGDDSKGEGMEAGRSHNAVKNG